MSRVRFRANVRVFAELFHLGVCRPRNAAWIGFMPIARAVMSLAGRPATIPIAGNEKSDWDQIEFTFVFRRNLAIKRDVLATPER